jgi:hypothetical protein
MCGTAALGRAWKAFYNCFSEWPQAATLRLKGRESAMKVGVMVESFRAGLDGGL